MKKNTIKFSTSYVFRKLVVVFSILYPMCYSIGHLFAFQQEKEIVEVGKFSIEKDEHILPPLWEPLVFKNIKRQTHYSLVKDNDIKVIKAVSNSSASGLSRKIVIDPEKYPIIQWSWKATGILANGDITRKKGADSPVQILIKFKYDSKSVDFFEQVKYKVLEIMYGEDPPIGALSYLWASRVPKETVIKNPYTDQVMMIVVQSGESRLNSWISEKRNVYKDYLKVFGKKPPHISCITIMTDTDNTQEETVSFFGDIIFKKK